ncbi:hypothetical protein V5O48_019220, partial [Marasmius crinis-equi]
PGVKDLKVVVDEVESQAPPATPQWTFEEQMAMRADGNTHWNADSEYPLPFRYFENATQSADILDSPESPRRNSRSPDPLTSQSPRAPESFLDPSEKAQEDALAAFVCEAQEEAAAEEAVAATLAYSSAPFPTPSPPRH